MNVFNNLPICRGCISPEKSMFPTLVGIGYPHNGGSAQVGRSRYAPPHSRPCTLAPPSDLFHTRTTWSTPLLRRSPCSAAPPSPSSSVSSCSLDPRARSQQPAISASSRAASAARTTSSASTSSVSGSRTGIDLSVYNSKGSIENVYAVYQKPGTQMGIVQSDVLAFVARVQSDPVLKRIAKKTKMVFPLYNEEIHLLGRQGDHRLRRPHRPARGHRPGGQRHLSHRAAPVQGVRGDAEGDGADRHRRGARRAEGRDASTPCSTSPATR